MLIRRIPIAVVTLLLIGGVLVLRFDPSIAIALLALAGMAFVGGLKTIPNEPPHLGILTFWGRRLPVMLGEGIRLVADYFPFKIGVNLILAEDREPEFNFPHIRCRQVPGTGDPQSGGSVAIEGVSVTWNIHPSAESLIAFKNAGGDTKVNDRLEELVGSALRQAGRAYTWEQMTFSDDELVARIIEKLTSKLRPAGVSAEDFVANATLNGVGLIPTLGIVVKVIALGRVREEGGLQEAADQVAIEQQEAAAEARDNETLVRRARQIRAEFPDLTDQEAMAAAQAARGDITGINISGSGDPLTNAAAILNQRGNQGGNS